MPKTRIISNGNGTVDITLLDMNQQDVTDVYNAIVAVRAGDIVPLAGQATEKVEYACRQALTHIFKVGKE